MEDIVPSERIMGKIYVIRGINVMLDRDLAELYGVETRVLNQSVKRNIKRFPDDFMFSLTREEIMNLSQFVISSKIKHAPNVFAFTEHGVAMLSSVLNSQRAIEVNIQIIRAFNQLRKAIVSNDSLKRKIEKIENILYTLDIKIDSNAEKIQMTDDKIQIVFDLLRELLGPPAENRGESKRINQIGFGAKQEKKR